MGFYFVCHEVGMCRLDLDHRAPDRELTGIVDGAIDADDRRELSFQAAVLVQRPESPSLPMMGAGWDKPRLPAAGLKQAMALDVQPERRAAQLDVVDQGCVGDVLHDPRRVDPREKFTDRHYQGRVFGTDAIHPGDSAVVLTWRTRVDRIEASQWICHGIGLNEPRADVARLGTVIHAEDAESGELVTTGSTSGPTEKVAEGWLSAVRSTSGALHISMLPSAYMTWRDSYLSFGTGDYRPAVRSLDRDLVDAFRTPSTPFIPPDLAPRPVRERRGHERAAFHVDLGHLPRPRPYRGRRAREAGDAAQGCGAFHTGVPHRAAAAFRAISERRAGERLAALAGPPTVPPRLPRVDAISCTEFAWFFARF